MDALRISKCIRKPFTYRALPMSLPHDFHSGLGGWLISIHEAYALRTMTLFGSKHTHLSSSAIMCPEPVNGIAITVLTISRYKPPMPLQLLSTEIPKIRDRR